MKKIELYKKYCELKNRYLKYYHPLSCLDNSNIDINPHQIEAFMFAVERIIYGGAILADEVGLGKTIETGMILKYLLNIKKDKILLIMPSSLRRQWQIELEEKFNIRATIIDGQNYEIQFEYLEIIKNNPHIFICSYNFAASKESLLREIPWDLIVIDEAHKLRNVHKNQNKIARKILNLGKGIPKLLLTATPIQNNLYDLFGLSLFIDDRIFIDKNSFSDYYLKDNYYNDLKNEINNMMIRTLRKDIIDYLPFSNRTCLTIDFELSPNEMILYQSINKYLKRDILFSMPPANKNLIIMLIRKLMASSSYAIIETFQVLKSRLGKLKESTFDASVDESLDFFFDFIDDEEYKENNEDVYEVFDREAVNDYIQYEIDEVKQIIEFANKVNENSKTKALLKGLDISFRQQRKLGINEKVIIFTESLRTQEYLFNYLLEKGYRDEIIVFNGTNNNKQAKEIYNVWKVKNYGKEMFSRNVEMKHAIVDYFKENGKILLLTDTGAEGLNLQFVNAVINYDLPWNPQKIEQRIGRCHRYGQKNDVIVMNFLNTQNVADQRVYELLSEKFNLFDGVFGSSDYALGLLESGKDLEKRILDIYQKCNTVSEFNKAFDKLNKNFDRKRKLGFNALKNILKDRSEKNKKIIYGKIEKEVQEYFNCLATINNHLDKKIKLDNQYFKANNLNKSFSEGYLILGKIMNENQLMKTFLMIKDNELGVIQDEEKVLNVLEQLDNITIWNPKDVDIHGIREINQIAIKNVLLDYFEKTQVQFDYQKRKIEHWKVSKKEFYKSLFDEIKVEINNLKEEEKKSKDFKEKISIRKRIKEKEMELDNMTLTYHKEIEKIEKNGNEMINTLRKQAGISPAVDVVYAVKY